MARDRSASEYSENVSDATSCSCITSSVDKCSVRGCGMFREPFFLHPPGSRPRDGIYINPMSAFIGEPARPKDTESFYLHSPHDLVYTRITRLFTDTEKQRNSEKKDEPLTVKVDVHVDNGLLDRSSSGNGLTGKSDGTREPSEHAYEQICLRQDQETGDPAGALHGKLTTSENDGAERSRPRKSERRYSRSSSASDSSNSSSEIPCVSSSASTPSLSRTNSHERIGKNEKKDSANSSQVESEKEIKPANGGASFAKPPPPPPPPPPPDKEDAKQNVEAIVGDEKKDGSFGDACRDGRADNRGPASSATNKSDVSCGEHRQPEVPPASPAADAEEIKANQTSHLVNKHMVLPFIPPQFANADSNTLLKPSEYLRSICKASAKSSLSKARSVDNLDIQSRSADRAEGGHRDDDRDDDRVEVELTETVVQPACDGGKEPSSAGPPPPPLSPLQKLRRNVEEAHGVPAHGDHDNPKTLQPLATISIQDLTSIQLRRTTTKMNATKTFSAPPPRSVSMTNVSESFFVQKTDLIAELKRTKDIPGIKKLKVEMAQVEKTQEQTLMSEISKAFNVSKFVDRIPEKDSSGNAIPVWKRQMLARKAAERAKKELEEQIARENEERRQKAIPAWKRQLLAKKDNEEKRLNQAHAVQAVQAVSAVAAIPAVPAVPTVPAVPAVPPMPAVKVDATVSPRRDVSPSCSRSQRLEEKTDVEEKRSDANCANGGTQENQTVHHADDDTQIIPWRAQLRKTNSKLSILD